jgi:hypothetical protein
MGGVSNKCGVIVGLHASAAGSCMLVICLAKNEESHNYSREINVGSPFLRVRASIIRMTQQATSFKISLKSDVEEREERREREASASAVAGR